MTLLQDYVDRQAQARPDAMALCCDAVELSYGELEARTNRLARALRAAGCERGDRVALLMPKSIDAIAGMVACLKAGCVYVPMDTASPYTRLQLVLRLSDSRLVLAASSSLELLRKLLAEENAGASSRRVGYLEAAKPHDIAAAFDVADVAAQSSEPLPRSASDTDLAHLLFTSGSTGQPKGVRISHRNVATYIEWAIRYFDYQPGDRISGHPPLHFDLSTMDVFSTFAAGATLFPVSPKFNLLPHRLADFIRENRLTQWFSVPSLLSYMAKFDAVRPGDFPELKRLLWCGEQFPTPALMYWMQRLPHATFTNLYGPTETTIASSFYRVPAVPANENVAIPIGQACPGESLHILDQSLAPVAIGTIGDLYIGGSGLSAGYWNDSEKTRASFIDEPFGPGSERIYRTGDLASCDSEGLVYLHGRVDSQIKSRGYRIELGEIEAALHASGLVSDAAVVAIDSDSFEGVTICCAFVPAQRNVVDAGLLRSNLAARVPAYMLPARWSVLDSLPLNDNGKIDRPQLRRLFLSAEQPAPAPVVSIREKTLESA